MWLRHLTCTPHGRLTGEKCLAVDRAINQLGINTCQSKPLLLMHMHALKRHASHLMVWHHMQQQGSLCSWQPKIYCMTRQAHRKQYEASSGRLWRNTANVNCEARITLGQAADARWPYIGFLTHKLHNAGGKFYSLCLNCFTTTLHTWCMSASWYF